MSTLFRAQHKRSMFWAFLVAVAISSLLEVLLLQFHPRALSHAPFDLPSGLVIKLSSAALAQLSFLLGMTLILSVLLYWARQWGERGIITTGLILAVAVATVAGWGLLPMWLFTAAVVVMLALATHFGPELDTKLYDRRHPYHPYKAGDPLPFGH